MKNSKVLVFLAILSVLVIACSQSKPTAPAQSVPQSAVNAGNSGKAVSVAIQGFKFSPADLTVKVGDTVEWTNQDSAPHTVESSDGTLKSDELSKGDAYSYTFQKPGKYDYICGIHPSMHGSVTVQ